jgi:hypothetical protein
LVALLLSLAWAGCTTTAPQPRLAKAETLPPPRLDIQAVEPTAQLTLETVIAGKGPGSWKSDARWDEYVVRVTNRTQHLLRVESATLVDFQGQGQPMGWDPWQLERQTDTNWEVYRAGGNQLRAGAGADHLQGATGSIAATDAALRNAEISRSASLQSVVPVDVVPEVGAAPTPQEEEKGRVVREFARRRLFLPVTLPPGGSIEGSLFFPMTPGPQRLVLNGRYGDTPVVLTLELDPLASLHFKPPGEPKEDDSMQRLWSWLQKGWDQTFGAPAKTKTEK